MLTASSAVVVTSLLSLGGCPGARTCNQGCSNVAQAANKVMSDEIGDLNPDDVQILTDLAIAYAGVTFPPVTDDQAHAVVTFLSDNNVQTIADAQALIQQAEDDPDSIVISDEVRVVIEQIIADPSAYIDAVEEFNETQM
jgi:hypothetical protein